MTLAEDGLDGGRRFVGGMRTKLRVCSQFITWSVVGVPFFFFDASP